MKIQVKFDFETICKNMLSDKMNDLDIKYQLNTHGEIEILQSLNQEQRDLLFTTLNSSGIEVVNNQQTIVAQKVKNIIAKMVREEQLDEQFKVSTYIEGQLPYSYSYLSRIFSETTHMSLEQFVILKKIDYVKELLMEDRLSLTEIAFKLHYSSVAHLSKQFKKTTGFNPSYFVRLKKQLNIIDSN